MSRLSTNEEINGKVVNGYDYEKQCWVVDGIIQRCGHGLPPFETPCHCYGREHAGEKV